MANILENLDSDSAGVDSLHHVICIDNGGKLAGSEQFRKVVREHGYILKTTAPDASIKTALLNDRIGGSKKKCNVYYTLPALVFHFGVVPSSTPNGSTIDPFTQKSTKHRIKPTRDNNLYSTDS
jgi:hypothetical protein